MTTARLDPALHDWIAAPSARAVITALEAVGGADCARFVGGCVRDALMGETVGDIDIATTLTPPTVIGALEAAGLRAIPTGIDHGTVTALAHGGSIEVTTLRRDVATDGRRAVVAFTTDWAEDSARRDFRCNAIYCRADGTLFDPQGGLDDITRRAVVFIGDPDARIAEDALRILRFFRFHARFGAGAPDRNGLLACVRARDAIAGLSGERVWAEMRKLLSADAPEAVLRWMQTSGVLRATLGPCDGLDDAAQLAALTRAHGWPRDPVLMLSALLGAGEPRAMSVARRLKPSRAERERVLRLARITCTDIAADSLSDDDRAIAEAKKLWRDGKDAVAEETRLCWARRCVIDSREGRDDTLLTAARDAMFIAALDRVLRWTAPEFPISGKDLKDIGLKQGKSIGDVLDTLQTRWIESKFTLDKAQLLMLARSVSPTIH